MNSKVGSLEEKVKLPLPTETISRCYQKHGNRKVIRLLTVAVYVLCVSLAAIILSLYYIFIWDPTTVRPFITKGNNCDKIVIPEKIAIRLLNSSEVTAKQFYQHILQQYRILYQLQRERQQYLHKQHLHFQQLAAANKFQEIFATATIIQANPNDPLITPTNGTYLLQSRAAVLNAVPPQVPTLDAESTPIRRKSHRKHYQHHRHNTRKQHRQPLHQPKDEYRSDNVHLETPLNQLSSAVETQPPIYTPMPIPLILNSKEDKEVRIDPNEKKFLSTNSRRANSAIESGYEVKSYLDPFLTGELIFEK